MEASLAQIPNQTIMIWVLFGFLLAWMVTFAVLACWSNPQPDYIPEDLPTPATSFPDFNVPLTLHMLATQQIPTEVEQRHQDSGEMETVPVA